MAFEITSDTVVKILVRRGLEVERQETLLSEGELGYSVDSQRLFIGDGYNLGGNPVANVNFGIVYNRLQYSPFAQPGDMIRQFNFNYVFSDGDWQPVNTELYRDIINIGGIDNYFQTLEYSLDPYNSLRIAPGGLGDGIVVDYNNGPSGDVSNTIQGLYSTVNFDARFLSLCAYRSINSTNDSSRVGSLYFGNIFTKTVKDNLSATVNVEKNISINEHSPSPYQLKLTARDLTYNSSLIEATSGNLYLTSKNAIYLGTNTNGASALIVSGAAVTLRNLDIVHTPANDGINPVLRIGEYTPGSTSLSGFSGALISYNESTNVFGISSMFTPGMGVPVLSIDRTGNTTLSAMTINDAGNISVGSTTGSKIGTATSQKLGFYNAAPIVQPTPPGITVFVNAGVGTAVRADTTFSGGLGSTEYTIGDIVRVLKNLGLIAQ